MVDASDLKAYTTTSGLGGAITGTQIISGTFNNYFGNLSKASLSSTKEYYKCLYLKNTHASENMDNLSVWLSSKSHPSNTTFKWAFDPVVTGTSFLFFDGTDDRVDCGNQASLWSQSLTKFSFSFWIYPTAGWDGQTREIVNHGGGAAQGFLCLIDNPTVGRVRFTTKSAANGSNNASSDSLVLNKWNFITCVYDNSLGSANVKIYVNKVVGGTTANFTEAINQSVTLTLGNSTTDFKGNMRDFRFWKNKALSQSEIDALYDNTTPPTPDYWLKINEGTGTPVDSIGGLTTTLTTPVWSYGDAQVIANENTAPANVTWKSIESAPSTPNFGKLRFGRSFPIWLWYHVPANATEIQDDYEVFTYKFDIPQGGTGTGGGGTGGTGGNPPPTNTNYKIAVAGDWGTENATDDVISLINDQDYDFIVGCGDNGYGDTEGWIDLFTPFKSKMISAYGNHEEDDGYSDYKTFFGNSQSYFTKKFQNILFIVCDTNINIDNGSTQWNFINNALTAAANDNTITWRIAVMHHPWFGASSDHDYNEFDQVQALHTLFQNKGVNIVCTGHNHNWQRSKKVIYNSNDPTTPIVVDATTPFSNDVDGIIHVLSGTGGHDSGGGLYPLGSQPSWQAFQNRTHNGVWEIVASNNAQTLTCQFRDTGGDVYDTITITA